MANTFKEFATGCYEGGQELAAMLTPPITWPVTVPVLGAILGATVLPIGTGLFAGIDHLRNQWQVWKRPGAGEAENSIRGTFGKIAAQGYRYYGGAIELKFEEATVHNVYESGKTFPEGARSAIHHNREQGAKDLLGNLAQSATPDGRAFGCFRDGMEERFIVVRKKGETSSQFYQAARIDNPQTAPAGAIVAAHHYYKDVIGHGGIEKERHYAITPVDNSTAERLQKLGL